MCIIKPELCHYRLGTCREPEWGEKHCMQDHYVYLANSSGVKVGITRHSQVPTRWIDQGAVQVLPIMKVISRYLSGLAEIIIAKHVSDKTSWQKMLKNQVQMLDLIAKRDELLEVCSEEFTQLEQQFDEQAIQLLPKQQVVEISYPIRQYPLQVKSFNFDKSTEVAGVLQGINGQYLLLDTGVVNIRRFAGYEVELIVHQQE